MKWYGNALKMAFEKKIDFINDDIKVALFTSSYIPNQDTDLYYDSITGQATGTGYITGGQALTTKTLTYDAPNNIVKFDANDTTWTNSTITARYGLIYNNTPASNKPLLAYFDFGSDKSSSAGDFTIQWNASGIATIQAIPV